MKVWEKIYIGTLSLFLIILNICIGTAFYLSYNNSFVHRILKPLANLTKAADAMSSGKLEQMVEVEGKDEIALLAQRFNHMAMEVSKSMAVLEEESKKKQQFIDDLAHEIRTPLTTIQGYSQLLQNVVLPEEKRMKYLSYMMNESKRIHLMSNELLKLSLLKKEPMIFGWINNESMLAQVVEPLVEIAKNQQITLLMETDRKRTYCNETLLQNVLMNLIKNAMNACFEGGEIVVGVYENRIWVRDTGTGMSEECKLNIFEPYYREDKSRSRSTFGTGLGMTICKQIVEMHQGQIYVTSQLQKGTLIDIVLPNHS